MKSYIAHYREFDGQIQTVSDHLKYTAELARIRGKKLGLPNIAYAIGLVHDLGKYSSDFQAMIRQRTGLSEGHMDPGKVDHSTAGAQFLYNNPNIKDPLLREAMAMTVIGHHGGLRDFIYYDGSSDFLNRMNKPLPHYQEVLSIFQNSSLESTLNYEAMANEFDLAVKRILTVPLAISSKEARIFFLGLLIRALYSCLIDADRTDTIDFSNVEVKTLRNVEYPSWSELIDQYEQSILKFKSDTPINQLRSQISKDCLNSASLPPGIFTLRVPTGGGKTLSSLRFGLHHCKKHDFDRVIYVLPFTTISDQNAQVTREILGSAYSDYVLEHHSNLLPENDTLKMRVLAENWDAPIVFTTMVQLLESAYSSSTQSERRFHQLSNSLIIFDEVQALEVKQIYLFNRLTQFLTSLCNSSVILCTATQPLLNGLEQEEYSLVIPPQNEIVKQPEYYEQKLTRVRVKNEQKIEQWSEEETAELIRQIQLQGKSVLSVFNTKSAAKAVYSHLAALPHTYHLSTSMCPEHRKKILKKVIEELERNLPVCLVSTQLIEAGVDVDFNTVIRSLSGLDSIVQAAGRCNRHGNRSNLGDVLLINPDFERLDKLTAIKNDATITRRILREFDKNPEAFDHSLLSQKSMDKYYLFKYHDKDEQKKMPYLVYLPALTTTMIDLLSINTAALGSLKPKGTPKIKLWYGFKTAGDHYRVLENNTLGAIAPYGRGTQIIAELMAADQSNLKNLLNEAQRYSVNLFDNQLDDLIKKGVIYDIQTKAGPTIHIINEGYYHETTGFDPKSYNLTLTAL
ncbi:CRISPR-associated helicase Cas3 [Clostridiaceae bacterium JG1575]|nr:CRISPR-associated helicase Cas3 [Clostridiaceae bacterium JG1575]